MTAWSAPQDLHDLAFRYALAVDNCDAEMLRTVFTADGVVRGYGENPILFQGADGLTQMIGQVDASFHRTMHKVFNQTFERAADGAVSGISYCTASHIIAGDQWRLVDMAIRYHNVYGEQGGAWKFVDRALEIIWVETRNVDPFTPDVMDSDFAGFQ